MYDYLAYTLRIRCDVPLPELVSARFDEPDILIARETLNHPPTDWGERRVEYDGDEIRFGLGGFANFLIRRGRTVGYELLDDMDEAPLNFAILGPLMALLLQLRGLYVLHGSALSIGGRAAMFVGDKGAGKSTTLGAILSAGHPMLTDDVLAIDTTGAPPVVIPGYPQAKLDPAVAERFALPAHRILPTTIPGFEKCRVRFEDASFANAPVVAGAVYVLGRGDAACARRLDAGEALNALLRFSYIVRFGEAALSGHRAAAHFASAATIANRVAVYALTVPNAVDRIGEVLPLIERHLAPA